MNRVSLITTLVVLVAAAGLGFVLLSDRSADEPPASGQQALALFAAYQESGDPEQLEQADRQTRRALEADPDDILAAEAATRIALTRHAFGDALGLADRAVALAPERFAPRGLRADALIELGRYDEAFPAVDERLEARPDLDSYARGSYAAELRGEVDLARRLMDRAAETSPAGSFGRRFAQVQQIGLALRYGQLAAAERVIEQAAAENPGDPEWVINRGRLAASRGDLEGAAAEYRSAIEDIPDADHLAELAEIEFALEETEAAADYLERSRAALDVLSSVEDNVLERALLDANWGLVDEDLLAEVREGRERRPSVIGDSALAWVLARLDRCDEAVEFARSSLRTGYRDPLFVFRAAWVEACAGNGSAARDLIEGVLRATPDFSPRWAPVARAIAAGEPAELPGAP